MNLIRQGFSSKVTVGRPDSIRMRLFWIIATVVALEDTCEEGDCALSLRQLRGQQFEASHGAVWLVP